MRSECAAWAITSEVIAVVKRVVLVVERDSPLRSLPEAVRRPSARLGWLALRRQFWLRIPARRGGLLPLTTRFSSGRFAFHPGWERPRA